jgi:AcrR family transcriptional regulator
MGYRHTKDQILAGAVQVAFDEGLTRVTYGRVAKALGISDRVVVYYFPSKEDLLGEVLLAVAARLQATLEPAFSEPADDHRRLLAAAWPLVATEDADPVFALFFEANGLAAAGQEPYRTIVSGLVDQWIEWTAGFLRGSAAVRRAEAETAIAVLDGLLLMRLLGGPEAADRAARRLGVVARRRR